MKRELSAACILLTGAACVIGLAAPSANAAGAPSVVTLIPQGSNLGGSNAVPEADAPHPASLLRNGVASTANPDQTFRFDITDGTNEVPGQTVNVAIAARVSGSGTSADDATVTVTQPGANFGYGTAVLHDPSPVSGDAFKLVVTVVGSSATDTAWMLYLAPTVNASPVPTAINTALGSSFPATQGSITFTPPEQTTATGSLVNIAANAHDEFGQPVAGSVVWSVTGRNSVNKAVAAGSDGISSLSYTDSGPANTESSLSSPSTFDTINAYFDTNGNGTYQSGSETSAQTGHYYTIGTPTVAAIEGGVGTAVEQFGATSPYAPVTSDDSKTVQFDETHDFFNILGGSPFFGPFLLS